VGRDGAASTLAPILHFDTSGTLLSAFGGGLFNFPHGIHVDKDGNVWITDHGMTPPNAVRQGSRVRAQ
jgi:streptogramin lyase